MLPAHVKVEDIDEPIRELVVAINELPFVDTTSSCSGHLDNRPHSAKVAEIADNYFLSEGWLSFQVDDRYRIVPEFMEGLERELKAYTFVLLEQKESGYKLPPRDNPYFDELSRAAAEELERYMRDFGRYSSHQFSIVTRGIDLPFGLLEQAQIKLRETYEMWGRLAHVTREFQRRKDLSVMLP